VFALEIDFHDGVSPPEVLFVRRPSAIVGTGEYAHVQIEGSGSQLNEIRILRGLAGAVRCEPVTRNANEGEVSPLLEGTFDNDIELNLGDVTVHVTSLDTDLRVKPGESVDRSGVRILRRALTKRIEPFPAIAVKGAVPLFLSFPVDGSVTVGRSRKCELRLDSADVSAEHARIGFDDGIFWVEDLGSTNGTLIAGERVRGRVKLEAGQEVQLGSEFVLVGVTTEEQVREIESSSAGKSSTPISEDYYPKLVALTDLVRPKEVALKTGKTVSIGRDPANDVWVGAPHVSRMHAELQYTEENGVVITDLSSNGSFLRGRRLNRGEPVAVTSGPAQFSLGEEVDFTVCFSAAELPNETVSDSEEGGRDVPEPAVGETVSVAAVSEEELGDSLRALATSVGEGSVFSQLATRSDNRVEFEGVEAAEWRADSAEVNSAGGLLQRFGFVFVGLAILVIVFCIAVFAYMLSQG